MNKIAFFYFILAFYACHPICQQLRRGGLVFRVDEATDFQQAEADTLGPFVFQRDLYGRPFYLRIKDLSTEAVWYKINPRIRFKGHLLTMEIYRKKRGMDKTVKTFTIGSLQLFRWRGISRKFYWWLNTDSTIHKPMNSLERLEYSTFNDIGPRYFMSTATPRPIPYRCCACNPHALFLPDARRRKEE